MYVCVLSDGNTEGSTPLGGSALAPMTQAKTERSAATLDDCGNTGDRTPMGNQMPMGNQLDWHKLA